MWRHLVPRFDWGSWSGAPIGLDAAAFRRFGHARSVTLHRRWLRGELGIQALRRLGFCMSEIDALFRLRRRVNNALGRLRDRDLQCWCPTTSRWCHADTLLELVRALPTQGD